MVAGDSHAFCSSVKSEVRSIAENRDRLGVS